MESLSHAEVSCSGINLVAPEGYVSVQINVQFTIGTDPRYSVASLDIPVAVDSDSTVGDIRNTALARAKSFLCPEVARLLPASFDDWSRVWPRVRPPEPQAPLYRGKSESYNS